ncbi:MAG: efflux RND transporter periplasmic adaptor subunit [Desulfarculaceae bacterium]|nr:efflux RND transporter periplasmic adaptor subunit [Desulfarculaceae bacterium]MCF8047054.1 efflux RND transporter periplasmic adaptor subunit [Desulfarculaceae bacterium]MCF8097256.1 efflux RND transporter periplasmic adaptor subunit [Desulfarculaceae bacterium]MCF8122149.1 efflux RND transporter periplasmic adaptor subunit [Desulfarculaceae bacterium]
MRPNMLKLLTVIAGCLALVALILHTGGFFNFGKIAPGRVEAQTQAAPKGEIVKARRVELPVYHQAVGTLRPVSEIRVEAQVPGRILSLKAEPGQMVKQGQELVVLDGREYQARLEQARQGLVETRAVVQRARSEHNRIKQLLQGQAATQRQMEQATEGLERALAQQAQAKRQVEQASLALGYTKVSATVPGRVLKRLAEPGDMALPGRPLLLMEAGQGLRLEALVPERMVGRVHPGQELTVELPAQGKRLAAKVEQIVPTADPATRTFLVKATLPQAPELFAGMYGRLLIPIGKRQAVLIPARAIKMVGQLEMVTLKQDGLWRRAMVTTGRSQGDLVEVLSGLKGGEELLIPAEAHGR